MSTLGTEQKTGEKEPIHKSELATRMKNALWGIFIGDSLSMPVHWYYNRDNIFKDFGKDGITQYEDAKHPHPEAFFVGMSYLPSKPINILLPSSHDYYTTTIPPPSSSLPLEKEAHGHGHGKVYRPKVKRTARESEHGNSVAAANERVHYHVG